MHNPMTYILICVITLTIANFMFLINLEFFGLDWMMTTVSSVNS